MPLESSRRAWEACASIRETRRRLKRFTYGRQWDDLTTDTSGNVVTEYDYALSCGRRPITNNLLRSLVKSVVGRFRQDLATAGERGDKLPPVLDDIVRANSLHELDARALEEFLISGCAIQRVSREPRREGTGVWVDNVNPLRGT